MLEVTFSDSVAGSLKYAAGRKKGRQIEQGAVAVFCEDPAEKARILAEMQKPKTWQGGELSCAPGDIVSLHLQLDFGDISTLEADPNARRAELDQLFGHYPGVTDDLLSSAQKAVERILEADELRLWIGEQDACDITAAFWLCHILRREPVKMYAVYLPAIEQTGNEIYRYSGAADFEPERLSLEAEHTREISPEMRRYMANRWCGLKAENAPLRAILNGMVASVPENIYDPALRAFVPEGECVLGRIVGGALSALRGVGDAVLYHRVRSWIASNILQEVAPARDDTPYSAVVRRGPAW